MEKAIIYEYEGRKKIADGMLKFCQILNNNGAILVDGNYTLSAAMVADKLSGEDLYEQQGIRLAAEAVKEINTRIGCGTRETVRMLQYLIRECNRLAMVKNTVLLGKDIKKAAEVLKNLTKNMAVRKSAENTKPINDITQNQELTQLIVDAMNFGEVVVKTSVYAKSYLKTISGMCLEQPPLIAGEVSLYDAAVLLTDFSIDSFSMLLPILEKLNKKPLFLVAEDFSDEVKQLIKVNVQKNNICVYAMKAPGYGRRKTDILGDLAVLTGTLVIHKDSYPEIEMIQPDILGKANIEISNQYTIISSEEHQKQVKERISSIEEKRKDPQVNFYDQQKLKERIAWLNGKEAIIYAGGMTLTEAKEEKLKIEYALAYAESIKKYGIVKREDLQKELEHQTSFTEEMKILKAALLETVKEEEIGMELMLLIIDKVASMIQMWLTTGAVMVSVAYDREDRELMKSGVDIERLRG